jgi:WD40 repeat protein
MIATGQPGINPKILVWSPVDPEVIYAKFEQPKGSKIVSHLSFDHTGRYIGSFGKDEDNSIYIFDLKTKSLYWEQKTDDELDNFNSIINNNYEIKDKKNDNKKKEEIDEKEIPKDANDILLSNEEKGEYLLDMCFNPDDYELCLVGVEKIKFGNYKNRVLFPKVNQPGKTRKVYTSCCYINKNICLVGNNQGKLYVFKDRNRIQKKRISSGTIQNITFKRHTKKVYISDSFCKVLILDSKTIELIDFFQMDSVVKSLDVNINHQIIMGLKNGEIKIKFYGTDTKHEQTIIKSHSSGSINDIAYIPEKKVVSVGDDNKILLYNLLSKKCESSGKVNLSFNALEQIKGLCVSYNTTKEHIALGLSNGYISIRKDEKHLDTQVINDIKITEGRVIILKFTDYGDFLLCSTNREELCLLDTNDNYNICRKLETTGIIYQFDWDRDGKFIQAINDRNKYIFYEIEKDLIELKDPNDMVAVEWPKITCKFNYTVQGVFQGSTNPDYINCVSKANTKKLICAGDEHYLLHLCNYPCVDDNPKKKKYRGHSGKIKKIIWNFDDSKLITIAENDRSIILWNLEEDIIAKDIEQKIYL